MKCHESAASEQMLILMVVLFECVVLLDNVMDV